MRLNSLAFRLFATAVWTLLVLPIAGAIIYSSIAKTCTQSFDAELKKLVAAISVDSMGGDEPIAPTNRFEPLFEVPTPAGTGRSGRSTVRAGCSSSRRRSPPPRCPRRWRTTFPPDGTGTRWMNVEGPKGEPIRIAEVVDTLGHERGAQRYSVIVAGPLD